MLDGHFGASLLAMWLGVGWALLAQSERGMDSTVEVSYEDFSDLSAFTLNGRCQKINAQPVELEGKAVLRLTDGVNQGSSAFLTHPISLEGEGVTVSFSTYFQFQMTNPQGISDGVQGADGVVFVVQTTASTVGGIGGGIGYEGIPSSVGIEFDTWNNGGGDRNDGNHVGINLNGSTQSLALEKVGTPFNNGAVWHAWVDYDGAERRLEVRVSRSSERPAEALLSHQVDLIEVLGQPEVFVGFSSGTGSAANDQDIRSWRFRNHLSPIGAAEGTLAIWEVGEAAGRVAAPDKLEFILDASGSMWRQIEGVSMMEIAKKVLAEIVEGLPEGAEVALRVYGHRTSNRAEDKTRSCRDSELIYPLSQIDKAAVRESLTAVRAGGWTAIGYSLSLAREDLGDAPGEKVIVLISDGRETCDGWQQSPHYPPKVVRSLVDEGLQVTVNVVGFGIADGKTKALLGEIAEITGGLYYDARDASELKAALGSGSSTAYEVRNSAGHRVAQGVIGAGVVTLPAGTYKIVIHARKPLLIEGVEMRTGMQTRIFLSGAAEGVTHTIEVVAPGQPLPEGVVGT